MPQKKKGTGKSEENVGQGEDAPATGIFHIDFPIVCKTNGVSVVGVKNLDSNSEVTTDLPYWVSVKTETSEDPNVKKLEYLSIRGWQIVPPVINALQQSLKSHLITTISLWEIGLTSSNGLLKSFLEILPQVQCKYLELEGSAMDDITPLSELLDTCSSLLGLRLRCCQLTDDSIQSLCTALRSNPPLQKLDLSSNRIGDEGAKAMSKALRVNNNLMVLSLANNMIGDIGACSLMESLREFILDHDETVQRRQLLSQCLQPQWDSLKKSCTVSRKSSSIDHRSSSSRDKLSEPKKSSAGAMLKATSFISKMKKGAVDSAKAKSKGKGKVSRDDGASTPMKESPLRTATSVSSTLPLPTGPLIDMVHENDEGKVVSSGNLSLISLSLSNNRVGSLGLRSALTSLEYQIQQLKQREKETDTISKLPSPPGLLSLSISNNIFPSEDPAYVTICDLIRSRDPTVPPTQIEASTEDNENTTNNP